MLSESVSVVIPTWNRRELLRSLLKTLQAQTLAPAEVVVVDDGGEDDSTAVALEMGAKPVRLEKNRGFAAAVNRGIEASSGKLIAILNNDVEPEPDWLANLGRGLGDSWFACGKLLNSSDHERLDGAYDEIARSGCACRCGQDALDGPYWNRPCKIRLAPFTAALFRRELFEEVGMLDERFESYLEDVDFGIRCALSGKGGMYVPGAVAFHHGSATLGPWHEGTVRRLARNQVYLVAKHYPKGWFWQHGWAVVVGQGLWGGIALRHSGFGAWMRGKWEGARGYSKLRAGAHPGMEQILREGEEMIRDLHASVGLSSYWRIYLALAGK